MALVFFVVGLLNFNIVRTDDLATHSARSAKYPFLWEMTGAFAAFVLLPALLAFMRRLPLERGHFWRRLPLHLAAMVAFGVSHTLLMWGSREALYWLLGWGTYEYGLMRYRFVMEGQKQLLIYWLVYAVVALLAYARRNRERELAAARLERQLTEARLAALKMQLNPHFLFNTLNMIASHVHDRPAVAEAMIEHLSDFLRLTLGRRSVQEVPLGEELEFLDAYLEIMKARFEEALAVEIEVAPGARQALVPHLILQPLVENSITHCMSDPGRRGRIRITAAPAAHRLRLAIEDNGPGLAGEAEGAFGRGIGLSNTADRLRHLYGDQQRLELVQLDGAGLRVVLEFPLRTAEGAAPAQSGAPESGAR